MVVGLLVPWLAALVVASSAAFAQSTTDGPAQAVVPQLAGEDVATAYASLRKVGFGVSVPRGFELARRPTVVATVYPSPGKQVNADTVVSLTLRCACSKRRPVAAPRAHSSYRLPNFGGGSVAAVYGWAEPRRVSLVVHFAPLEASYAPSLLTAYSASGQTPGPGTKLERSRRTGQLATLVIQAGPRPATIRLSACPIPPYSSILGVDADAVVYSTSDSPSSSSLSSCLLTSGVIQSLGESSFYTPYEFDGVGLGALAGHYAALLSTSEDKADSSQSLAVADLTTGKQVNVGPGCSSQCYIDHVVINASGFVAWHQLTNANAFPIAGLSCPSTALCVAVDGVGNVLTTNDPAGGTSAWNKASIDASALTAVSCASTTLCVALDERGRAFISTNPTGGSTAWTPTVLQHGDPLTAISCTGGLCAATDGQGQVFTSTDPASPTTQWTPASIDPGRPLTGISCPSSDLCVADDGAARVLTSTAPTGGPSAWTPTPVTGLPTDDSSLSLSNVSCYSTSLCVAIGEQLDPPGETPAAGGRAVESTNPTGGSSAWTTSFVPTPLTTPTAVACASPTLCVIADVLTTLLVSTNPTAAQPSWSPGGPIAHGSSTGLSCPAAQLCVAGDNAGHVSTSADPSAGTSSWTTSTVDTPDCSGSCTVEEIYARDTSGPYLVDHTEGEGSLSQLTLTGDTLTWNHDGTQESTTLG